jgi:hypothetical protein
MTVKANNPSIFEMLKNARAVGGLSTSMQSPDLDENVLARAILNQAKPSDVALWLHDGSGPIEFTVERLQTAQLDENGSWALPDHETLWIVPAA